MSILHNMYRMRNIYFSKCIFVFFFQVYKRTAAQHGHWLLTAPHHSAFFAKGYQYGQA
jgi:hypothetical protein